MDLRINGLKDFLVDLYIRQKPTFFVLTLKILSILMHIIFFLIFLIFFRFKYAFAFNYLIVNRT